MERNFHEFLSMVNDGAVRENCHETESIVVTNRRKREKEGTILHGTCAVMLVFVFRHRDPSWSPQKFINGDHYYVSRGKKARRI